MDIRKLQRAIVNGLEDVKAQNIVVYNTEALSPLFERVIIASGTSNRQTKALAASVREAVKAAGAPAPRTEGEDNGEWIIVDCGAAVAHIMQPAIRDYYRLEEIWGIKPVVLKSLATAVRKGLPKAGETASATAPAAPAKAKAGASRASRSAPKTGGTSARTATGAAAKKVAGKKPSTAATGTPAPRSVGRSAKKSTGAPARKATGAPAKTSAGPAPARKAASRTRGAATPAAKAARKAPARSARGG